MMKIILVIFSLFCINSCYRLDYYKLHFPNDMGLPSVVLENSWLQVTEGSSWQYWRFDFNYLISNKDTYERISGELSTINKVFNCGIVGTTQFRCIFWGEEIVSQISKELSNDYVNYSLEILNEDLSGHNGKLEFKVLENVDSITHIFDSVIQKIDP